MTLIGIIFYLGLTVAVIGLVCRFVPLTVSGIRFRDTSPEHASSMIAAFAEGTFESRFGFPTGFFHWDEKKSDMPRTTTFAEAQPSGTVTDGCVVGIGAVGAAGLDEGAAGCAWAVAMWILATPFMFVSLLDRGYRKAMKSKVVIDVAANESDSIATLKFYGISGYLLKSRYARAFAPPTLPEGLITMPAATSTNPGSSGADSPAESASSPGSRTPSGSGRTSSTGSPSNGSAETSAGGSPVPPTPTCDPPPTPRPVPPTPPPTPTSEPSATPSPFPPTPRTPLSAMAQCHQCNSGYASPNDRFCITCGAPRSAACPSCGDEGQGGNKFCTRCGAVIGS